MQSVISRQGRRAARHKMSQLTLSQIKKSVFVKVWFHVQPSLLRNAETGSFVNTLTLLQCGMLGRRVCTITIRIELQDCIDLNIINTCSVKDFLICIINYVIKCFISSSVPAGVYDIVHNYS